ncbi:MAG: integrase arm-type DNA-binding domain-containing protein [Pseudomonadota bacterium]
MARGQNRLTATAVEKRKTKGRMIDGAGLILRITESGARSWIFRYTYPKGGKVREMGLGGYPAVSLANAREIASGFRTLVANGVDPKAERDKGSGKTFGQAADSFYGSMQARWASAKSRHQWKRTLMETCAPIRGKPVADIDTEDVLSILQPLWQSTPESASRVRGRIENVLDFAKAKHWRSNENPARWRGHLENILPKRDKSKTVVHHPAMSYADIPAFVADLQSRFAIAARALEFLILTATRTNEALGAKWDEIDFDKALWTIPADRMKLRKDHVVPLAPRALEILQELHEVRYSDFCFPGQKHNRPYSNMVLAMLLRRMNVTDATPHGFRSSFRDWAGDTTIFPREVAEAALAHSVGGVEGAYRRGTALEKRRQLMNAWADFCSGAASGKVVQFHG